MDERMLTLIFLLMAGVLPLRELAAKWDGRPERRNALRGLWGLYLLVSVGAIAALVVVDRREDRPPPPPTEGSEQFALHEAAGSGISAG
jgi:hypothetical protein